MKSEPFPKFQKSEFKEELLLVMLKLVLSGITFPSNSHIIDGGGLPVATQSNRTLCPS